MDLRALRKPWVVALALTIAGVGGATAIFFSARRIHEKDKRAILRFEAVGFPAVVRAMDAHRTLAEHFDDDPRKLRPTLLQIRIDVERSRRLLDREPYAAILVPSLVDFMSGIGFTLEALAAIEDTVNSGATKLRARDRARYEMSSATAGKHYAAGSRTYRALRCRARLPSCES